MNEISKELKIDRKRLSKDFDTLGIKKRDKSETQALRLKNGKAPHPTRGKPKTDEQKIRIGQNVSNAYADLSEEEKLSRQKGAKDRWDNRSYESKKDFRAKGVKAFRNAATIGSKMEHYILRRLLEDGYEVMFHKEHFLQNNLLQLDIFLPKLNIAIEIDGPTHHKDIWTDGKLLERQQRDQEKNGLLLGRGLSLIRVKHLEKRSLTYYESVFQEIVKTVKTMKDMEKPQVTTIDI